MTADARMTLSDLAVQWEGCTKCDLHVRRDAENAPIILGEGMPRGYLFVGEAPSLDDERSGSTFSNREGSDILIRAIDKLQLYPVYLTYLVACRSCSTVMDEDGNPRMRHGRAGEELGYLYSDQPPTKPQQTACRERLVSEIYMADPIVIIALGQVVASSLFGSHLKLNSIRGTPMEISIPGAGMQPLLTAKGKWGRMIKGEYVRPMQPTPVRYTMIPTYAPAELGAKITDRIKNNPFDTFEKDLLLARSIFVKYHEETTGVMPTYYEEAQEGTEEPNGDSEEED